MINRKKSLNTNYLLLFHIYSYRIEETESFLNMLQVELISEKKKEIPTPRNSKNSEKLSIFILFILGFSTS